MVRGLVSGQGIGLDAAAGRCVIAGGRSAMGGGCGAACVLLLFQHCVIPSTTHAAHQRRSPNRSIDRSTASKSASFHLGAHQSELKQTRKRQQVACSDLGSAFSHTVPCLVWFCFFLFWGRAKKGNTHARVCNAPSLPLLSLFLSQSAAWVCLCMQKK